MEKLIAWVEIPTTNFESAIDFYNTVFNLDLQAQDFAKEKMAFFPNNEGALIYSKGYEPSRQGPLISFKVPDSIDRTLARIHLCGGKTIKPKTNISSEGDRFFAIFLDSEGNRIGLYEN